MGVCAYVCVFFVCACTYLHFLLPVGSASQPHTSDYESGGDSASTEKLASPQHLSSSQRQLRPLSISLVPVDSTMGKQVREKREVAQKQNSQDEWTKDSRGELVQVAQSCMYMCILWRFSFLCGALSGYVTVVLCFAFSQICV